MDITASMLGSVGFTSAARAAEITIAPGDEVEPAVPEAFTGRNRIPILMLGPLLHLTGEAFVPLVGGDPIGGGRWTSTSTRSPRWAPRSSTDADRDHARRPRRLHGTRITLPYPSVGATESVMLSAVLAEGNTVIRNAAVEPEVMELALFLQRMGARHPAPARTAGS